MNEIVNIIDVAKRAGVAKSTVSNVLTGKKYVSPELREKVLKACEELDYHPNFYASALSSKKSNIIALLMESSDDIDQKMYKNLIVSCVKEVSMHGYSLLIYYNSDREKLLETLRRGCAPIDGAIMMSPYLHDERLAQIDSQHISFVVIGRPENSESINYIDVDNVKLVKNAVCKLVELSGSNDVYLVNSSAEMTISQDRVKGFLQACAMCALKPERRILSRSAFFDENVAQMENKVEKGSIFITCDDLVAREIYRIAERKNLVIGEDVSVFALGRSTEAGTFDPPLSHAKQDYNALGKNAASALISLIEGNEEKTQMLIDSEIVFGNSVKKI